MHTQQCIIQLSGIIGFAYFSHEQVLRRGGQGAKKCAFPWALLSGPASSAFTRAKSMTRLDKHAHYSAVQCIIPLSGIIGFAYFFTCTSPPSRRPGHKEVFFPLGPSFRPGLLSQPAAVPYGGPGAEQRRSHWVSFFCPDSLNHDASLNTCKEHDTITQTCTLSSALSH